jgi:transposase
MTELPDNILHLPQYQVLGCKSTDDEMHFQVDVPDPIACEECGVQGEFVRFGKRDVPYRDLPIHGKRVTLWVVRRRYTCRACKTTFRPQLPEMVDGFRMTLRLHEYVEKESFNHPSGNPEPSQADIHLTTRLKEALALVDVRVLDHIIVGTDGCYSLVENGNM